MEDVATAAPAAVVGTAPHRASTARALTVVGLVAALVAAGLAVWVRTSGALVEQPVDFGLDEPMPATLAGGMPPGKLPPQIAKAVNGAPVLVAVVTRELPESYQGCAMEQNFRDHASVEAVVYTPDGLMASLVGPAPEGMFGPPPPSPGPEDVEVKQPPRPLARAMCMAVRMRGGWQEQGASFSPVDEERGHMSMGGHCCDDTGRGMASVQMAAPDGSAWALQERGDWWFAVPVGDLEAVPFSWKFRDGPFGGAGRMTHVLWVDAQGAVIEESYPSM